MRRKLENGEIEKVVGDKGQVTYKNVEGKWKPITPKEIQEIMKELGAQFRAPIVPVEEKVISKLPTTLAPSIPGTAGR